MKPILKIIISITVSFQSIFTMDFLFAQNDIPVYSNISYVGLGIGINDYGFGGGLEMPFSDKLSAYGNIGAGGWGFKIGVGLSYYTQQAPFGSSFSLGYSHAIGVKDFEVEMEVKPSNTSETVLLDLKPVGTINLFYSYSWILGRSGKFSLSAGYAFPLEENAYTLKTQGVELSKSSEMVIQMMQPGGLIVGMKFMFGF